MLDQLEECAVTLGPLASFAHLFPTNLGMILDRTFKFDQQLNFAVNTSVFQDCWKMGSHVFLAMVLT